MSRESDRDAGQYEQLSGIVRKAIDGYGEAEVISPEVIGNQVLQVMDPESDAPILVSYGCSLEIRQIARGILRRSFDPVKKVEEEQADAFDGHLQDRYPVERDGQRVYVLRQCITPDEGAVICADMRKKAKSLNDHADAAELCFMRSEEMSG